MNGINEAAESGDQRAVQEERLVRAAYYANMAANLIERLDADSAGARDLLVESGYDIVGELRNIVSWAKEERDQRFPLLPHSARCGSDARAVGSSMRPMDDPYKAASNASPERCPTCGYATGRRLDLCSFQPCDDPWHGGSDA